MAERVLLLTGFGPFPGVADNPTALVAEALQNSRIDGCRIVSAVLPVAHPDAAHEVARHWRLDKAAGVLHLGVATQATLLRVETLAHNELNFRVADVAGHQPLGQAIDPARPLQACLAGPWPVDPLLEALARQGLPAERSVDAGRYVCNATWWSCLHAGIPSQFLHVPPIGSQCGDGRVWTIEALIQAASVALGWLARQAERLPAD